jgi:CARDB
MRRSLPAVLLLLCLAVPAVAPAARPRAEALVDSCEKATVDAGGTGVFVGRMRSIPGARRMQMRFTLQTRVTSLDRWTAVAVPGFDVWTTSAPGRSRYVYTKTVEDLLAPGSYRVSVRFRWLDAGGGRIGSMRDASPRCQQPDPRPNLRIRGIGVEAAADPGTRRYVVLVRNNGHATAGASSLTLTVAGEPQPDAVVPQLAPGEGTLVTLDAPACKPGTQLSAEADSGDAIDERDEADNTFSRACPKLAR